MSRQNYFMYYKSNNIISRLDENCRTRKKKHLSTHKQTIVRLTYTLNKAQPNKGETIKRLRAQHKPS